MARVDKQAYTLDSVLESCTYIAPVKSIPVMVKGSDSHVQISGRGGGSGTAYTVFTTNYTMA